MVNVPAQTPLEKLLEEEVDTLLKLLEGKEGRKAFVMAIVVDEATGEGTQKAQGSQPKRSTVKVFAEQLIKKGKELQMRAGR